MTRFVLLFFCCAVLAGGCLTSAAASEYRDDVQSGRIVFATGFETAAEQEMKLPQCYSIGRFGRNGSHCLKVERRNPKAYTLKGFRVSVVPGKNYLLEFYARSGNLRRNSSSSGAPGIAGFEYYGSDGKWIAGKYLHLGVPGEEWRKYSLTLSIPENPKIAKVSLLFYLCKGWTGTLWIDDIMLRNLGTIHSAVIVEPGNLCFRNGDGRFILKCYQDSPDALAARLTLSNGGKDYEQVLEVGPDKILRGDFGKLSPGKAGLKIELLDRKRKKIIARESFRMRVTDGKVPENAALIDRYGRLIVNGKPFMPVGAFATLDGNLEKQVGRLQEAGLNSVIGYCNFAMKAAPAKKTQQENILAALDLLERSGIKSIFCVKECIPDFGTGESFDGVRGWLEPVREIARAIRKHPALLAWYIGDEVPVSNIGNLIRLRETLAEEDPFHPAWTVTYEANEFPRYATASDIVGYDGYPFRKKSVPVDLRRHYENILKMNSAGLPHWGVPQVFCWGNHLAENRSEYGDYIVPSLENMRTAALLFVAGGAKGFLFYSMQDIFTLSGKYNPDPAAHAAEQWKKVGKTAEMLKELEPFIMSAEPAPGVTFDGTRAAVRAFRAEDGRECVVIVPFREKTGPIKLKIGSEKEFVSKYGHTGNTGDGMYEFTADRLESDLLFSR